MHSEDIVRPQRRMSAWEKNLLGVKAEDIPSLLPGLLLVVPLAWVSIWLSQAVGVDLLQFEKTPISPVMVAILLGLLAGNALPLPHMLKPGLTFAVKKVLRLGIILLGLRLSVFDVFRLGALGVPIVLLCIVSALVLTTILSRWFRLPERLGTLIAVGTSICGVSAIVGTGPAIGAKDEEIAYAVAVITIFGLLATLAYPFVANVIFAGHPVQVGLFLGTSIHDTAQVTGAALVFADVFSQPRALDVATVAKLVRNVFMAAVIPLMAFVYSRRSAALGQSSRERVGFIRLLPLFVLGFLALAVVRSTGDAWIRGGSRAFGLFDAGAWQSLSSLAKRWSVNCLVVALAGVGLSTRLRILRGLGLKPFVVGLCAALSVGVVSYVAISLLGWFVSF